MGHFDPPRAFFLDNFERGGDFSTKFLAIPSLQHKTFGYMKNFLIRPYILGGEDHIERSNFGSKNEFFSIFSKNFVRHAGKFRYHKDFRTRG